MVERFKNCTNGRGEGPSFTLRWKAEIPAKGTVIHEAGLDLVLVENGLVTRNEVYFDRSALLAAIGR